MVAELRFSDSDPKRAAPPRQVGTSSLALARWCVGRGWPVHPLAPGRKTPAGNCSICRQPGHSHRDCGCADAGRWCHGFHAATLDYAKVEQWWATKTGFGVGVACGPAGLVVIDIDAHNQELPSRDRLLPGIEISADVDLSGLTNGFHTLGVLAALRGEESPADDETTLRVRTPSGGLHVWYRVPTGQHWQCSAGSGGGRALAWQVDIRAHGGYIVAPGTMTVAGVYQPVGSVREPAPLPDWVARELERTGHLPPAHVPVPRPVPPRARQAVLAAGAGRTAAAKTLASLLADVAACAAVSEGAGFSEKLNRAAYTAGGLIAAGYLTDEDANMVLEESSEHARPGQHRRYRGIIRSGLNAGRMRPLSPGGRC